MLNIGRWLKKGMRTGWLLRGARLKEAEKWLKEFPDKITAKERKFIEASIRRKRWVQRLVIGSVAIFLVVVLGLSVVIDQERKQKRRDHSLLLVEKGETENQNGNVTNATLLALEALPKDMSNSKLPSVVEAEELLNKVVFNLRERLVMQGHSTPIEYVAFSPDGTKIITAGEKGEIRLWKVQNGQLLKALYGHHDSVLNASFSPDGSKMVTVSEDQTIRLWNIQDGQLLHTHQINHQDEISNAVFSPDGKLGYDY
jgi:hypothetical protein